MTQTNALVRILLLFAVFIALTASCSKQDPFGPITISTGNHLTITFVPGANYYFKIFSFQRPATIACWLETLQGKYADTLFVSHNAAKNVWFNNPQGQPGALPVWAHLNDPKKTDAVSGATLKSGEKFVTNYTAEIPAGIYTVKLEVNNPYDYNEAFPAKLSRDDPRYSGDNGQPSLVYSGKLKIGGETNSTVLKIIGAGSPNGQDGKIHGLKGITTALRIVDKIDVRYE